MDKIEELNIPRNYKVFIRLLIDIMKHDERIESIFLFESCARGLIKTGTDVDIAIIT